MSKRSLEHTIMHSARHFNCLSNIVRHLKNYQDLREFLQEEHPEVYEDWLDEISREPVIVAT